MIRILRLIISQFDSKVKETNYDCDRVVYIWLTDRSKIYYSGSRIAYLNLCLEL